MDQLLDSNGRFICFCCLIILNDNKYVLAPDCFSEAFYNGVKITPIKQSVRHLYSLSPIDTDKPTHVVSSVSYTKGMIVKIAESHSAITGWHVRENGSYVLNILHMADPRRNGLPVFSIDKQLVGMYLCVNWFDQHATILPIDVVSEKSHGELTQKVLIISTSGFVHGKNLYLESPADFRQFDINQECGEKTSVPLPNKKKLASTKQKTPIPAIHLSPYPAIEAYGMVFLVKEEKIVRVLDRSHPMPINGLSDEVVGLNEQTQVTPSEFFSVILDSGDKEVTIRWSNGDVQQFPAIKTELGSYAHVWKPLPHSNEPAKEDPVVEQAKNEPEVVVETKDAVQSLALEPVVVEQKMEVEGDACAKFDDDNN